MKNSNRCFPFPRSFLVLASISLALQSCLTGKTSTDEYLDLDNQSSLSIYDSVEILIFAPGDSQSVLDTVWLGKLGSDTDLRQHNLGKVNQKDFDLRIKGFANGFLAYQSTISRRGDSLQSTQIDPILLPGGPPILTGLSVRPGDFSPSFASDVHTYTTRLAYTDSVCEFKALVPISVKSISVNGDSMRAGEWNRLTPNRVGENEFLIQVSDLKGSTGTYRILTKRAPNSEARLRSLRVADSAIALPFLPDSTSYTFSVPNATKQITVFPDAMDANASLKVNGMGIAPVTAFFTQPLVVGKNKLEFVVQAQDGTTRKTYTLLVDREPSDNAFLANLSVSAGTFAKPFQRDKFVYSITTPSETSQITIMAQAEDSNATITVDGLPLPKTTGIAIDLPESLNLIYVTVVAQDTTVTKSYVLSVTVKP